MNETFALLIALAAVIGIFVVIPLVVFLIVRKVLSDRHRERMAMIESGLSHKYRTPRPNTEQDHREAPTPDASENNSDTTTPQNPPMPEQYRRVRAEDSTIKWMYIFGGAAIGLILASVFTHLLFAYTLIETRGLGLSIVVLSVCVALYLYYVRKNKRDHRPCPPTDKDPSEKTRENEPYTEE